MKVKKLFTNLINIFKKVLERFPLTVGSIIFLTLFISIFMDSSLLSNTAFTNITTCTLYFTFGNLLTESIYKEKTSKRTPLYITFAIASIFLTILKNIENLEIAFVKIIVCYISTLAITSVYFLFKHSNTSFENYTLKVFSNITKNSLIYGILAIGIAIIYSIFVYLILDISFSLLAKLEFILLGIYYATRVLYSFVDIEAETSGFYKGLIKYVLSGLVFTAFVIIYMYIFKILIFRDMPKNQVFRILSALFIIGMPIWTMAQNYKENTLWNKINSKFPIAFIPFIFLQIYSIGIRIINNGFTPSRYICVMLILFEIIYVTMYIIKKEKIANMLFVLNALIIISVLVPALNMFTVSNISQYNKLKLYFDKDSYTNMEKASIYSAYNFLKYSVDGKKYLDNLSSSDIEKISSFHNSYNNAYRTEYTYISATNKINKLELNNFSSLYFINSSKYNSSNSNIIRSIIIEPKNSSIKLDLTNEIKNYISIYNNNKDEFDKYFETNAEIAIDSNTKLIIKNFSARYNPFTLDIFSYSIEGYLLVKNI